jgi:hypothetical protein
MYLEKQNESSFLMEKVLDRKLKMLRVIFYDAG